MSKRPAKQLIVWPTAVMPRRWSGEKFNVVLHDADAEKHDLLRIIDESGEDYLYPKKFFRSIVLPQAVKKAILAAA